MVTLNDLQNTVDTLDSMIEDLRIYCERENIGNDEENEHEREQY